MKKTLLLLLILSTLSAFSQDDDAWIYFNDKPNSATFLNNPLTMLTQRSLDRRTAQGIALNIQDVPVYQPYINQITAANGIVVLAKSKWLNCVHVRGLQADITALLSLFFVNHIHWANNSMNRMVNNNSQNGLINKQLETATNFNYGNSANQIQMLNGHLLHQQNFTGTGKIIAVLDAGFPSANTIQPLQSLQSNNQILGGYDFVNKSTNFYTGNSHGTLVLSCMGGYKDGQLVGTAPDASYYLYITEDINSENPVEESNWVEAAEEADRVGVDVITSSLGYFGYDNPAYSHSYSDMTGNKNFASQGANIAFTKGIVVVASAGNEGATSEPHVGVPAEATNVLAIGAVQANRNYAGFSSIGPSYDGRVKPDVMAQGQAAVLSNTSGTITTASGTSFSGPIMAGMIASFWQAVPNLSAQQVVNFVKQSSDKYNILPYTNQYGYGIPNFQLALNNALGTNNSSISIFELQQSINDKAIRIVYTNNYKDLKLSLFNILGQFVLEENITHSYQNIDLNSLSSGIYIYKVEADGMVKTGKILKR
jgi:serine protease AprX